MRQPPGRGLRSWSHVRPPRALPPGNVPNVPTPTVTCVSQSGHIECKDESGSLLKGDRLAELQQLLKPITEAPSLADSESPVVCSTFQ
jgi:hypothetical protein